MKMPLDTPPRNKPSASASTPADNQGIHETAQFPASEQVLTPEIAGIEDKDVITIAEDVPSSGTFKILSLAPNNDEPSEATRPFKLRTTVTTGLPQTVLDRFLLGSRPSHFQRDTSVHIIISTLAGTGLADSFFEEVLQPCIHALGLDESEYRVTRTDRSESVKKYASDVLLLDANRGKKQSLVLLSGDGGVVDTVNGLMEPGSTSSTYCRPNIILLPFGTGNALFHSLHARSPQPSLYIQGLRTLLHGTPQTLPLFRATFSPGSRILTDESRTATPLPNNTLYGAVVASYGLHSTLVADSDTPEYRKHGDKRFGLVAKDLLFPPEGQMPHAYRADVTLRRKGGGEEMIQRGEHGYLLMTLVSNLEKTFKISPDSTPLDGRLRIVHFGPVSGERAMGIMMKAYDDGKHVDVEEVGYESVEGVRISFREEGGDWKWRRCCIDGLIVGVEEGGWMDVALVEGGTEVVDVVVD